MVKIIVDPGSNHYGVKDNALKLIEVAAECGANAIKFQLFKKAMPPNINLPFEWFPQLVKHGEKKGIEVFASVWENEGIVTLLKCGCKSIKFAHSMNKNGLIDTALEKDFKNVFISYSDFNFHSNSYYERHRGTIKRLFCIPKYPFFERLNFYGLFWQDRFHGFSDHSLGLDNSRNAVRHGAEYIEKHFKIPLKDSKKKMRISPDDIISLNPNELYSFINEGN